ncbi:MAG: PIG-L family deacetylase [Pyrinomonadaceae bacterium]
MPHRFYRKFAALILAASLIVYIFHASLYPATQAQVRTTYDSGAAGLGQLLRRLQTTASAMHVAAHPDDEDSAVIARLTRGDGARVAYLSLTRGEGGQNIIGRELFDALGVIRTEELLQARRLDGGDQFFTRAVDFGFTKTRREAADKWGEQAVLEDIVRAIRIYRPLIIFSRFSGTDSDGHGQHQLAGYLAPLALRAAGDPAQFPEQIKEGLRPWLARKLYLGRFGAAADANSVQVQTGEYDQLLGRTYFQIALEGRSQHKSQEMGRVELLGPQSSTLRLVEPTAQTAAPEKSLFDGIDTSITGIATLFNLKEDSLKSELASIEKSARQALENYQPFAPQQIIAPLVEGLNHTRQARELLRKSVVEPDIVFEVDFLLKRKEMEFTRALKSAAGVVVDVLADAETVAPGESLNVSARAFVTDKSAARVGEIKLRAPAGWTVEEVKEQPAAAPTAMGRFFREVPTVAVSFRVSVPQSAALTAPYWLREQRTGYLFTWPADAPQTEAVNDPLMTGEMTLEIGGARITLEQFVEYRFGDRVRGELRRNLNVAPAMTVALDPGRIVVPLEKAGVSAQRVTVRLTSNSGQSIAGTLQLQLPKYLTAEPTAAPFTLSAKGERATFVFNLKVSAGAPVGNYQIKAVARTEDGRSFDLTERLIAYPHIQTHRYYQQAVTNVQVMNLKIAPVNVGYVMGSGDDVPEAIKQMGLQVTMIDENELSGGDLSRFDTVVVGVRASEVRPDLVSNNKRLLDYVSQGGTLIVQYQQGDYVERGLAPYPAKMAARTTDERAPVRILEPAHPVFNYPNKITEADWETWVQERSLYNFTTYDARYLPLLESHDAGESDQTGGQVYARLGRGHYVYTSYAWFRQLPAGVPGAFRLFANLLSLSKASAIKSDNSEVKNSVE